MIKLELTKSTLNNDNLKSILKEAAELNQQLFNSTVKDNNFLGWIEYPNKISNDLIKKINDQAVWIQNNVDILLIIGIGGSYLGAKAGIESINGFFNQNKIEVLFVGFNCHPDYIKAVEKYCEKKTFAINVISKSGSTLEINLVFNHFKKILQIKKPDNYNQFIIVTTDLEQSLLKTTAIKNDYHLFAFESNIGGRYSVLTPVGLLAFAVAGLNIKQIIKGAQKAYQNFLHKNNQAVVYGAARFALGKSQNVELLITYNPFFENLLKWCQQLYAESEGKDGKGTLPITSLFSTDLHSLGQFIQAGSKNLFETTFLVKESNIDITTKQNKSFNQINQIIFEATTTAHFNEGKVENLILKMDKWNEISLGYYFYFHMQACAITSLLNKVNPFNQPDVEVYKKHIKKLMK